MAYLEYPKHVYLDGDAAKDSAIVTNAEEERLAGIKGYAALPSVVLPEGSLAALQASPSYLEFPKHVYRDEDGARVSIVVKDADEEAAAVAQGYAPLGVAVADEAPVDGSADEPEAKRKPGRPPKAK